MFYEDRARVIGKRIKENRKRMKLSQPELLKKVYLSEKTVASLRKWERGERLPDLTTLARMAELFECDIGYLLGDYDEKRRRITDVSEITGLSAAASATLTGDESDGFQNTRIQALEFLLTSVNFKNALQTLVMFKDAEKEAFSLENAREKAISSLSDISEYRPNVSFLELINNKRQAATLCEYNLSNDFTFVIQELRRIVHEEVLDNG